MGAILDFGSSNLYQCNNTLILDEFSRLPALNHTTNQQRQGLYAEVTRLIAERQLADSWQACQGTEAIIFAPLALGEPFITEKLGVPCYLAMLQPGSQTREFPNIFTPPGVRLGGIYPVGRECESPVSLTGVKHDQKQLQERNCKSAIPEPPTAARVVHRIP